MTYRVYVHYCKECGHLTRSPDLVLVTGCENCISHNTELLGEDNYDNED